eukprot:gnl/MRDRNA2_/MRDRNA2_86151_c0_seq2.p1 gnl/MRDRNA2_/MRDRNA2_86151_c0~~gnl/MRDRNA2_/MRDRNA2_86151_c0_seq2.p1  ORF type:complete len:117 (+),score=18.79 gnl/MRDRNA2_/MRDRNA2_86151_c0_seq2:66-416(+)
MAIAQDVLEKFCDIKTSTSHPANATSESSSRSVRHHMHEKAQPVRVMDGGTMQENLDKGRTHTAKDAQTFCKAHRLCAHASFYTKRDFAALHHQMHYESKETIKTDGTYSEAKHLQ